MKPAKQNKQRSAKMDWVALAGPPNRANQSDVRRLTLPWTVATNAGGFLVLQLPSTLVTTASEWASFSARFTLYRVLSMRLRFQFMPLVITVAAGTPTATAPPLAVFATDRSGSVTAPASPQAVAQLQNAIYHSGTVATPKLASYEARALDLEDQEYISTSTSAAKFAIVVGYQGPLGGTTNVGLYTIEFAVEFKGTK